MGIASMVASQAAAPKLREPFTEFRPLGDRVVIFEDEAPKVTDGGLVIPDEAQKKPARGTVIAVGPEVGYQQGDATQIRVGDRVVYSKYSGAVIRLTSGKSILCIPEKDVYGILDEASQGQVWE